MGIRKKNNLSELGLHLRMSLLMKVDLLSNYLGTKILITIIFIDTAPHLQKTIRDISVSLTLKLTSAEILTVLFIGSEF